MHRYCNNHQLAAKDIILMKDRDLDAEDRMSLDDVAVRNVVQRLEAEEQEQSARPRHTPSLLLVDRGRYRRTERFRLSRRG
uniref:Uncharacterized protein n=1 Tax=Anguilla anguilla TaxID=7936 RepID=A0A0E9V673_ANGAN